MTEQQDENGYYNGPQSLAPVPLHVGSAPIKPEDRRQLQGLAVESMHQHAGEQIEMLKKQAELIMQQAREIEERVRIAHEIYHAEIRFTPKIHNIYYFYEREDGSRLLSMIAPNEWGKSCPWKTYLATVKLLGDQTWEILDSTIQF